jgi:outer membrane protein assembly factor BamB
MIFERECRAGARLLCALILPVLTAGSFSTYAQTGSRTFVETGKVVAGRFLDYWDNHGGLAQQGYPISDEMQEVSPTDGKTYLVQYFERAVFEYHPENTPPFDVLLSLLGTFAYQQKYLDGTGAPAQQPNSGAGSLLFEQTGKHVGGRFLEYWQQNGGVLQQGYPISEEFTEVSELNGQSYKVQYFERAVFEYHPENTPPFDVLLSQLGTVRYKQGYLPVPTVTPSPTPTSTTGGTGSDWSMYGQNPGRTGYSGEENVIGTSNVQQLVSRWQAPLGTNGNPSSSSPVVAGGRVYVGSSAPEGPNFYAFDASSGLPSWSANVGYFESCDGVGIGSTAAISGTVLVVGGGDAAYYGLNADTGEQMWRVAMDAGPSAFAWESPLLAHGRAYIGIASDCDNPSVRGEVRALDMFTGDQLASRPFVPEDQAGAGIWNSPALSPDGTKLVVATGEDFGGYDGPYNRAMVLLDPLSLDVLQAKKQGNVDADGDFATSPIVFDHGGRTLVFAGNKDRNFYMYDLANIQGGAIWHRDVGFQVGVLPAYAPDSGGTVLFVADRMLYAVDPDTGVDRWPPVPVGKVHSNIAVANHLVFLNGGADGLKIIDIRSGKILRTILPTESGPTFSGVALAHGFVYWVSGSHLNAWSLPAP